ncbi:uncharacterized protein LOC143446955 [Clavelina lepadiformis]|uniref:uncharacterized protein LOC143446955 n=1 Tax=Clavelina lepadiformis TaxID=159417 RepID=UPI004041140E
MAKVGLTCADNPCEHGGACLPIGSSYSCACPFGVYGYSCETASTLCNALTCQNGGTCVTVSGGGAKCLCREGFSGNRCQVTPRICNCQNGGTCPPQGTVCLCPAPFKGNDCSVGPCTPEPCRNGGACIIDPSAPNYYTCDCFPPYYGDHCELTTDEACSSNPCLGPNCQCFESCKHEHGYYCMSQQGYIGQNCDIGPPTLTCHHDRIVLEVSAEFYDEYDFNTRSSFMYLSSTVDGYKTVQACQAQPINGKYRVTILPPFTTFCGTTRTQALNSHTYNNTLWINRRTSSSLYDMPFPVLDWSCTFNYDLDVVASLEPVIDVQRANVSREQKYTASVSLCKVSSCQQSCPSYLLVGPGAVYTVSETIHLSVNFNTNHNLFATSTFTDISNAFLSCSSDTTAGMDQVSLSGTGCNYNSALDVRMGAITSQHAACMSFKVPRFHQCTTIYIHLRLRICSSSDVTTSYCSNVGRVQHCPSRITKRSTRDDDVIHVIGPITIVDKGVDTIEFVSQSGTSVVVRNFSNPSVMREPIPNPASTADPNDTTIIVFVTFSVFFVLIILFAFVSLLYYKRYKP